jgi:hypothetical protein
MKSERLIQMTLLEGFASFAAVCGAFAFKYQKFKNFWMVEGSGCLRMPYIYVLARRHFAPLPYTVVV